MQLGWVRGGCGFQCWQRVGRRKQSFFRSLSLLACIRVTSCIASSIWRHLWHGRHITLRGPSNLFPNLAFLLAWPSKSIASLTTVSASTSRPVSSPTARARTCSPRGPASSSSRSPSPRRPCCSSTSSGAAGRSAAAPTPTTCSSTSLRCPASQLVHLFVIGSNVIWLGPNPPTLLAPSSPPSCAGVRRAEEAVQETTCDF